MKITRIQYTVQPDFAERNKQNIAKVMAELRSSSRPDIRYSAYVMEDGKTFMHVVEANDETATKFIPTLESFKHFQTELKGSSPEVPPKFDNFEMVGSSFEV